MASLIQKLTRVFVAVLLMTVYSMSSALADPNPRPWENWKTDFERTNVDMSAIISGGPPKDGIPAIDNPKFISIEKATALSDREPVIGIEINGDARAYPLGVLMRHEIANDVIGGKPVIVTYCPLCNSAIVFDAMIDGKRHDFGTTGRLRNSDLVMYDRQTESWWQQFSGEALIGHYVGTKLVPIPSRMESFGNFKKRFPKGTVMAGKHGSLSSYGVNPYTGYDSADRPFLYRGEMPKNIDPMERVVVIRGIEKPVVVTMKAVRKKGKMNISGYDIAWTKGQASALDTRQISEGKDVGNITVTQLKDGKPEDIFHDITFAFVAHAFMPDVAIIKQ
jgi:hypothetical protein